VTDCQEPMDAPLETVEWLLTTTRSVRRRLDLTRPVERALIEECLQLAVHAPSAEAKQSWRWFVITDPDRRRVLADYYRMAWNGHNRDGTGTRRVRWRDRGASRQTHESARWLAEHLHEVPVLVIPCVIDRPVTEREVERLEELWRAADDTLRYQPRARLVADSTFYGSIYPAIWSFELALRSRGLGSSITTMHLPFHQFVADELGIPRHATQIALLPVAHTRGTGFRPASRVPARSLTYWDEWERPRGDASLRKALMNGGRDEPTLVIGKVAENSEELT
jgi:nitroreductase